MPTQFSQLWRRTSLRAYVSAAVTWCLAVAGCHDQLPVAPHLAAPHTAYLASAITCSYTRGDSTVPCAEYAHATSRTLAAALAELDAQPTPQGSVASVRQISTDARAVYFGEQKVDVYVTTSNATLSGGIFQFNMMVQDLAAEPLGTADGRTPASDSIIVFYSQLPTVSSGTGTVKVGNPTGYNTFTGSNQPYYRFPGLLPSNATTAPMLWKDSVSGNVQGFNFAVYVAAQVPDTSAAGLAIPAHAFDSLAVGEAHSCAIRTGNHEYCWGFNAYGALGVQETAPITVPEGVLGNLALKSMTAGSEFSCALAASNAYCWGDNLSGEIGDGTTIDRGEPVVVTPPTGQFSMVAAGTDFACGLVGTTAYCWGDNYTGQLGDGTTTSHATPLPVAGGQQFVALTVGAFHACGVTAGGAAYCWGANADGELGIGNTTSLTHPTAVVSGVLFASITAGNDFTCGVNGAGAAYCWGANTYGAVGSGSLGGSTSSPQLVTGGVAFKRIAAGAFHACGVSRGGAAYCWGGNDKGQIGDGSTTDRSTPTLVPSMVTFTAIAAGFGHTCALTTTNASYCWGDNTSGQLGDGTLSQRLTPTAVLLP